MRNLTNVKPIYLLPTDPYVQEVLIPAFKTAKSVSCMVGFFTSNVFSKLAPGLATYISGTNEKFRLIVSPVLKNEDVVAIEKGVRSKEEVATDAITPLLITEDWIVQHTLKCLTYLLKTGRMEIKIALMKNAQFHMKVWIFQNGEDVLVAHGSSNMTVAGLEKNIEQVMISKNWIDESQNQTTQRLSGVFEQIWENNKPNCLVLPVPEAIRKNLIEKYDSDEPPQELNIEDFNYDYQIQKEKSPSKPISIFTETFHIPEHLKFEEGPFEHQGMAVSSWCGANYRGVLEMATGSGKTITSMICAYRLFELHNPLLIVVAAPYIPLIEQWCEEVYTFGLRPSNMSQFIGKDKRVREIRRIKRQLSTGTSKVEVIIVSHDTLCDQEFQDIVQTFECARLLIADEVHNLGRPEFIGNPPTFFENRLGLSATPVRQYDQEGTKSLFDFFGESVFKYTLDDAIGNCLVEYDYFLNPVELTTEEMDQWFELTDKIKANHWRANENDSDDVLMKLYRDRRKILETAENKILALSQALEQEPHSSLKHTLIYATDKEPEQLNAVNKLLHDKKFTFHQLTANETVDTDKMNRIIESFKTGDIQIITAKRVLDEGVNIPQICRAYVLASTTVERQWVQRRGRLLRTCSDIGKKSSAIHDFVVFPPNFKNGLDYEAKNLLRSEYNRIREFWRLSRNPGSLDGALDIMKEIVDAVFLDRK